MSYKHYEKKCHDCGLKANSGLKSNFGLKSNSGLKANSSLKTDSDPKVNSAKDENYDDKIDLLINLAQQVHKSNKNKTSNTFFDKKYDKPEKNKTIKTTLAEYLRTHDEVVFHGVQNGGRINSDISYTIVPTTPPVSDFHGLYIDHYINECYITIVPNRLDNTPDSFFYQIDEKYMGSGWKRQIGKGRLTTENQLTVNETDGAHATIALTGLRGPNTIILYRTRYSNNARGNHHPFDNSAYLTISSPKKRNAAIYGTH
jgi:hypothetical protein